MSILNEAKAINDILLKHRRYIHQNAELEFDLPLTRAYVLEQLRAMGYDPKEVGGGIVALVGGKKAGKTFLIRGDMDALPILEESDLEFKSETGAMHACGHDFHTTSMLGAAQLLKNHEDEIEGTVKLMFQPAEEILSGAEKMIQAGLMENPNVDAAMMIHVASALPSPTGSVIFLGAGPTYSAADWFRIDIQGKGSHGAIPNEGVDPINVASHIHIAMQEINSREVPPRDVIAMTVGEMHSGNAGNVLPDTAYMIGTIRTLDANIRELVKRRLTEIAEGVGATFRAKVSVEFSRGCPAMIVSGELESQVQKYTAEMLGENMSVVMPPGTFGGMGSEDFAFISNLVPSVCAVLVAGSKADGYEYPIHHPKVVFDESVLPIGAALYTNTALEWLKNNK